MSKHTPGKPTPGPWTIVDESSSGPHGDVSFNHQLLAGDLWLAAIASGDFEKREEVDRERPRIYANLSLIAAAPDLLAALKALEWANGHFAQACAIHGYAYCPDFCKLAREAIAKAEGK